MKKSLLFTLFLTLFSFPLLSQQMPEGKLLMHHFNEGSSQVSYIASMSYPSHQYQLIDSGIINSFCATDTAIYYGGIDLFAYYLPSESYLTLGTSIMVNDISCDDSLIAVSSYQNPYVRIYRPGSALENLIFFDSTLIHEPPVDILIAGSRLFLLQNSQVQVIDLETMDTLTTIPTPMPFHFGGMNMHIIEGVEDLFISMTYATGAERFSMVYLNKNTLDTASLFHVEFAGAYYPPVITANEIYVSNFPSYYSFANDTFYLSAGIFNQTWAVEYDDVSNCLFVSNYADGGLFLYNPTLTLGYDSITIQGPVWSAHFVNESIQQVDEKGLTHLEVFPNPVQSDFNVKLPADFKVSECTLYTLTGQSYKLDYEKGQEVISIRKPDVSDGTYLLGVRAEDGSSIVGKIVVLKAR
jgi:hypothetical protein